MELLELRVTRRGNETKNREIARCSFFFKEDAEKEELREKTSLVIGCLHHTSVLHFDDLLR